MGLPAIHRIVQHDVALGSAISRVVMVNVRSGSVVVSVVVIFRRVEVRMVTLTRVKGVSVALSSIVKI